MPVIDKIKLDDFTEIIVFQVSESAEVLLEQLNLKEERLAKYKSLKPKQALEYLGLRRCLQELNQDVDLFYTDKGKPYLESDHHISITHSYGMVAVALSEFSVGIDIELNRPNKVINIERKFIRPDEKDWIPMENREEYLHIIWGIKEGLYKLNGGNLWNFLHHYRVEPFELKELEMINCWISDDETSRKYFAYYKSIGNYFLIWVTDYI